LTRHCPAEIMTAGGGLMAARFELGRLVITAQAHAALDPKAVVEAVQRHRTGDWGDVDESDRNSNDEALKAGGFLLSVYRDTNAITFWIVTEADRSSTTILLPSDY